MSKKKGQGWYKLLIAIVVFSISWTIMISAAVALPSGEGIQDYQKNVHLSPEHKQRLVEDITRYRNAENLWDVLRDEFSLPHYENSQAVQTKIEWFMNNQDFLLRSASRAAPYLYYILQQARKRHLPAELVLLPIVESGYNPFSLSNMGAAGIWQIMPGTATGLGIKHDWSYDGRRDVIASTRGALNYLAYLQSFFEGNWLLAIAAYNTGEGNVLSAIRKNIRDGRDTDFWSLPVAQQTKDYVPSLLALATIISNPDKYPVYLPPVRNAPYLGQVEIGSQINLKYAAELAGLSYKRVMQLNSGFSRPNVAKSSYKLVLPIENVEQFTENLAISPLSHRINWLHYKVKTGDTLATISKKFNVAVNDVRKMNHLTKMTIRPGTNLLLPNNYAPAADDLDDGPALVAANETHRIPVFGERKPEMTTTLATSIKYALQPGDTVYMVRSTDTLASIAKRFHLTPETLQAANQLRNGQLQSGTQLIIPTHMASITTAPVVATANKVQPGDTIYMVRRGDSIETIAQRFHVNAAAIRLTNLVDNSSLSEGEKLVIPTHMRS